MERRKKRREKKIEREKKYYKEAYEGGETFDCIFNTFYIAAYSFLLAMENGNE